MDRLEKQSPTALLCIHKLCGHEEGSKAQRQGASMYNGLQYGPATYYSYGVSTEVTLSLLLLSLSAAHSFGSLDSE